MPAKVSEHKELYGLLTPILKNILSNWLGLGANLAISFFMAPYTVHKLGDVQYGIWAVVLQLTGYMGIFDVGLRSALVRFVSRSTATEDQQQLDQTLSTAFITYCGLALIALILGLILGAVAPPHLHVPADLLKATRITIWLASLTLALGFPLGMFSAVLSGCSRWDLSNGVGLAVLLLRSGLVLFLLYAGYGVVALAVAHLLSSFLGWMLGIYFAYRVAPFHLTAKVQSAIIKPIFSHSWNSLLISVANRINYQIDTIVVAAFLPVYLVTVYVIGFELIRYFRELLNGAAQVVAPVVSGLEAKDREHEVQAVVLWGGKYIQLLAYFGITTLIFIGPQFIGVWMGQQYVDSSGRVLQLIALSVFASATAHMPSHALYGLGKHQVNVWCTAAEAVINLGLSLLLVKHFGIYGVALSTLIAAWVVRGVMFPNEFLKIFKISWSDYLKKSIAPGLLSAAILASVLYGLKRTMVIDSYPRIIATVVFSSIVFCSTVWLVGLNRAEKENLERVFRRLVRLPPKAPTLA